MSKVLFAGVVIVLVAIIVALLIQRNGHPQVTCVEARARMAFANNEKDAADQIVADRRLSGDLTPEGTRHEMETNPAELKAQADVIAASNLVEQACKASAP